MRFLRRWRLLILAWTIFGVLYISGYSYVRGKHYLVHYSGFASGNTDNHRIDVGDLGLGFNSANRTAAISYWVFTPLRWVETGYWYLRYPAGQPWPYYGGGPNQQLQLTGDAHDEEYCTRGVG